MFVFTLNDMPEFDPFTLLPSVTTTQDCDNICVSQYDDKLYPTNQSINSHPDR